MPEGRMRGRFTPENAVQNELPFLSRCLAPPFAGAKSSKKQERRTSRERQATFVESRRTSIGNFVSCRLSDWRHAFISIHNVMSKKCNAVPMTEDGFRNGRSHPAASGQVVCQACRSRLSSDARFCKRCGAENPAFVAGRGEKKATHKKSTPAIMLPRFSFGKFMTFLEEAKNRYTLPIMLLVMALLVFFEYRYNVDLLNNISDPETTPDMADTLSQRGKMLAAFGITWALFRNLVFRIRNVFAGLLCLFLLTLGGYWTLDTVYNKVIDGLKPEVKVMGFNLLIYRQRLLTGEMEDSDIPKVEEDPVNGRIFMGAFPMVLLDERFMLPAQDLVAYVAEARIENALRQSDEMWEEYNRNMEILNDAHKKYIAYSQKAGGGGLEAEWESYAQQMQGIHDSYMGYRRAVLRARGEDDLTKEWNQYNKNMNTLRAKHREFINGSRQVENLGSHRAYGESEFRRRSGGLSPNSRLPLSGFPALLKRANDRQIRAAEARIIGYNLDGTPIRAGEIPYFLSREGFEAWIARRSAEGLGSANLSASNPMRRDEFVDWVRGSDTKSGADLRRHEETRYGFRQDGSEVFGRDAPYFMGHDDFILWASNLTLDSMLSYGMPPDVNLDRKDFLELLRRSKSAEGERLRDTEDRVLDVLPDGTPLRVRDVPYFMSQREYTDWVRAEAERQRALAVPTAENINEIKNINQVNAAIFIPPMAIISSLTSALVNALSFAILLFASALTFFKASERVGVLIKKYCVVLMLVGFSALVFVMPSHVFKEGTELYNLETKFHQEVGFAARLWSRLSNVQKMFL